VQKKALIQRRYHESSRGRGSQQTWGRFLPAARAANIKPLEIFDLADLRFKKKFLEDKSASANEFGLNQIAVSIL